MTVKEKLDAWHESNDAIGSDDPMEALSEAVSVIKVFLGGPGEYAEEWLERWGFL